MTSCKFLVLLAALSFTVLSLGCKSGGSKPSNPFAQNQTVPPPNTFSSQEQYLGQMPGGFVPQTPATTYPASGAPTPPQPMSLPAGIPMTDVPHSNVNGESASLFASTKKEADWQPVDVVSTSHTAFQAMDAKTSSTSIHDAGMPKTTVDVPESVIVGTSHVVTTITDETQPAATLSEPQSLYSGQYTE